MELSELKAVVLQMMNDCNITPNYANALREIIRLIDSERTYREKVRMTYQKGDT